MNKTAAALAVEEAEAAGARYVAAVDRVVAATERLQAARAKTDALAVTPAGKAYLAKLRAAAEQRAIKRAERREAR